MSRPEVQGPDEATRLAMDEARFLAGDELADLTHHVESECLYIRDSLADDDLESVRHHIEEIEGWCEAMRDLIPPAKPAREEP